MSKRTDMKLRNKAIVQLYKDGWSKNSISTLFRMYGWAKSSIYLVLKREEKKETKVAGSQPEENNSPK